MTPEERAEIVGSVATLQGQLEALVVRGVRAVGGDDLKQLAALHEDLGRIGAGYLGSRIGELIGHARTGDPKASAALCGAQTALRVFDRVLTLHAARELLAAGEDEAEAEAEPEAEAEAAAAEAAPPPPVKLEDRAGLLPMLGELASTVESLIATGLSTASAATRQKLDVSFKEASRRKLLRLGASLRYVNEELGRFLADASAFSGKRFAFFLHRSWLMARGLHEAIRDSTVWASSASIGRSSARPSSLTGGGAAASADASAGASGSSAPAASASRAACSVSTRSYTRSAVCAPHSAADAFGSPVRAWPISSPIRLPR